MAGIGGVGSAAVQASLVQAADGDVETSAKLLNKSLDADKDLVNTLLPPPGSPSSKLDIKA